MFVVIVPRLGGWGTKIFQVPAVGHGRRVLGRLGLRGPDESDLPVKHMATKRLGQHEAYWLGRFLVSPAVRLVAELSPHDPRDVA